jgi:hypothetical protein
MKKDLSDLLLFLSKPYYSRNEVLIMITMIFFIIMLYGTTTEFLLGIDNIPKEYLYQKIYLNWIYLMCSICITYYSKIIQDEEINCINHKLDNIENNLCKEY